MDLAFVDPLGKGVSKIAGEAWGAYYLTLSDTGKTGGWKASTASAK